MKVSSAAFGVLVAISPARGPAAAAEDVDSAAKEREMLKDVTAPKSQETVSHGNHVQPGGVLFRTLHSTLTVYVQVGRRNCDGVINTRQGRSCLHSTDYSSRNSYTARDEAKVPSMLPPPLPAVRAACLWCHKPTTLRCKSSCCNLRAREAMQTTLGEQAWPQTMRRYRQLITVQGALASLR